jgi:hypothetical protein
MERQCRFCKISIHVHSENDTVCKDCIKSFLLSIELDLELKKQLMGMLVSDKELKFLFLESVLDEEMLMVIAKCMFRLRSDKVGLEGSASIAEFFRGLRK